MSDIHFTTVSLYVSVAAVTDTLPIRTFREGGEGRKRNDIQREQDQPLLLIKSLKNYPCFRFYFQ